ncbi:anti-sigma factor family protein [Paracerasibacillus soli]|uniref:Anti-sigma-W factor RsiW n=1 Tax=Paracerasibacillus soli TaxID=480284 RepID=A0ABU5CV42_9BACI|nr:zf-HC2 domain-containing protein [Virgibacillus soli]MDY0410248.1 zf-HC2 domain-containing protein [Virgibacillus soli]
MDKLDCNKEIIQLMHIYLDGDISMDDEAKLRKHLEDCSDCQKYFHELKRTITLVKSVEQVEALPTLLKR